MVGNVLTARSVRTDDWTRRTERTTMTMDSREKGRMARVAMVLARRIGMTMMSESKRRMRPGMKPPAA